MFEYGKPTTREFKITNFEGPLELLLKLIKEAKVDIKDIFMSEVTEQYLEYMRDIDQLDMDTATEFLEVAAQLLEIKSAALLPKLGEEEQEEDDPAALFIARLEEFKLLKEAGEKLKEHENVNRFFKEPDDTVGNIRVVLTEFNLDNMLDAFSKLLTRFDRKKRAVEEPKEIKKEVFTIPQKLKFIKSSLIENKRIRFFELFATDSTYDEVVSTFLALLVILKEQFAYCTQSEAFGDIDINIREQAELEYNEGETGDYDGQFS